MAKINNGKIIKFRIEKDNNLLTFAELKEEYVLYKISLKNIEYVDESSLIVSKEILKTINTLEFYFRTEENCAIYFDSFKLA